MSGCGSSNLNTQLATWASENYECPEGAAVKNISKPARGQWCEKEGKKHGREVWHHQNLVKAAEIVWVDGEKHNLERWWRPEGLKHLQIAWNRGKKHGLEIRWTQRGGFGQATCFVLNEQMWSTASAVEAQTRTCIPDKKVSGSEESSPQDAEDDKGSGPEKKDEQENPPAADAPAAESKL